MIELNGLRHDFGERQVLTNISLKLPAGKTLTVFGPNGAGKTTLLRVIATLLTATEGEVSVLGHSLPGQAQVVRSQIGFLGHEPLLYRELTPRENLRFYGKLYGVADLEQRCRQLLEAVAISTRANDPVRELSRGMAQRVAVCRALLNKPKLLLLDEPRSHLDPAAMELVDTLLGKSSGLSRVVVTHELEWGLQQADLVLGLDKGRVELLGAADNFGVNQLAGLYQRQPLSAGTTA